MTTHDDQKHLDEFERNIKGLQVEFARYFAGDLERPPFESRDRVNRRLKQLRSRRNPSTAERFRLNALAARLGSLNELFDRRLAKHGARVRTSRKPTDAVVAGSERGTQAVRRLFLELYKAEKPTATIAGFEKFLEKQVTEIRTRTGCSSVQFRVIENDGRRTLKAKPLGKAPTTQPK